MSMQTISPSFAVHVYLGPDELDAALVDDARTGLTRPTKELPPTWLYDEVGCALFEAITRLPEYYPTRVERSLLHRYARDIAARSCADTFVELGSGVCDKTRVLLDAFEPLGRLDRYVPFDVAEPTLRAAAHELMALYPHLTIEGIVGDFRQHLGQLPSNGRRLIAMLGGTIGNLDPNDRATMLRDLVENMIVGDTFLVGTDMVKDRGRLVRAYDDSAGVTAAFNLNVLTRLNRHLGADFDKTAFTHVARFDEEHEWIEMRLRSRRAQTVRLPALDLTIRLAEGEDVRTEISAKFRPSGLRDEMKRAGLVEAGWFTDPAGDYVLSLWSKGLPW